MVTCALFATYSLRLAGADPDRMPNSAESLLPEAGGDAGDRKQLCHQFDL